ncbi:MAG: hypothetical protein WBZ36_08325 [Candidatus Nitrosopolaris sp.]
MLAVVYMITIARATDNTSTIRKRKNIQHCNGYLISSPSIEVAFGWVSFKETLIARELRYKVV